MTDLVAGSTHRADVSSLGVQANAGCVNQSFVGGLGQHIVFECNSSTLVPGVSSGVFVRDEYGDGDGYGALQDCNDISLAFNPGALELCTDGLDNDCDGFIDCQDTDCIGNQACCLSSEKGHCGDGIDNDCDGLKDCLDRDCRRDPQCM